MCHFEDYPWIKWTSLYPNTRLNFCTLCVHRVLCNKVANTCGRQTIKLTMAQLALFIECVVFRFMFFTHFFFLFGKLITLWYIRTSTVVFPTHLALFREIEQWYVLTIHLGGEYCNVLMKIDQKQKNSRCLLHISLHVLLSDSLDIFSLPRRNPSVLQLHSIGCDSHRSVLLSMCYRFVDINW